MIFDLDGTLLNTLEEIATAANTALAALGYPTHPVSAYRLFVGGGAKKLAWRILPEDAQTQNDYERLFPVLLEVYSKTLNTLARPYDGILEALGALNAAGVKMAVLSNKPEEFTISGVKKLLPGQEFFAVRGGRADTPLKPAPDGALALAKAMGVKPEKVVFVGDSNVDISTARNAGMIPVGVAWGFRSVEELTEAGAALVLEKPEELPGLAL